MPRASVVFVTAAHVRSDEADAPAFSDHALYDVGQAAAHLTLQATAMGLHAHQVAGFDHDALAAALGVPATHQLLTASRSASRATRPRWTSAPPPATTATACASRSRSGCATAGSTRPA